MFATIDASGSPEELDTIVMGTITGAPLLPFCVLVTKALNVGQGHYHHVASVDHVKMNSWYRFGECSTIATVR